MEEVNNDFIALEDEQGNELAFEMIDVVAYEGKEYAVLLPLDDESDEPELVILELMDGNSDEDELRGVEDQATLEAVFALFLEREKNRED